MAGPDPATLNDDQLLDYIRQTYPAYAGFLNIPDVKAVLIWSTRAGYDQNMMLATLRNTDWYKNTSSTARDWMALSMTDPATAGAKRTQKIYELNGMIRSMGASNINLPELANLADQALMYGWDPTTTKVQLASWAQAHPVPGSDPSVGFNVAAGGDVGAFMNAVKATAHQYLVGVDNKTAADMAWRMYRGEMDEQGLVAHFANQARYEHPDMSRDIDNGATPTQIMAPVTQTVAQMLEVAPETIDYLNPQWSELLTHRDADGKIRRMTQSEAGVWSRSQTGWDTTENGRTVIANANQSILQAFGKVT